MKKSMIMLLTISSLFFYQCSSGKKTLSKTNIKSNKSTAGSSITSYDEPSYKTDRRLAATMTDSTNNTGALGDGTGASYASYSYRSRAYKLAKAKQPARNSSLATYQSK